MPRWSNADFHENADCSNMLLFRSSRAENRFPLFLELLYCLSQFPGGKPVSTFPGTALLPVAVPGRKTGVHFSWNC
ncbi:hypothetical protein, partial [Daeguia caeni]|uniref:hypothetical protein n=1 Tax=Daeguia caeni TaxID=439612 RepID=UPI0035BC0C5A